MNDYHEDITAEQIRQQMDYVRSELHDDVEKVVEDASSLGDVRAYVKAQPAGWLVAAAVAGYFLVPSKKQNSGSFGKASMSNSNDSSRESPSPEAKRSSITGAALGLAATMATRMLTRKVTEAGLGLFSARRQSAPTSAASERAYQMTNEGNIHHE